MTSWGVDVSKWQPAMRWTGLYADGVRFMFARASLGGIVDPMYAAHVRGAEQAGLLTGAYHYLWPGVSAEASVDVFLSRVGHPEGRLLALDVEEKGLTSAMVDDWIAEFRRRLPTHPLFIYINRSDFANIGRARWATDTTPLWLAYWPDGGYPGDGSSVWGRDLGGWPGPTIWQYGARRFDGMKIDGNAARISLAKLRELAFSDVPLPDTSTGDQMAFYMARPESGTFSIAAGNKVNVFRVGASGFEVERTYTPSQTFSARYDAIVTRLAGDTKPSNLLRVASGALAGLYISTAESTETPAPDSTPFDQSDIDAAIAADRAKARIVWA